MTELARLRLWQILDSGFPSGAFAHSFGLEAYAQAGMGAAELEELLGNILAVNRLEAAALVLAYREDPAQVALELQAAKPVASTREASLALGRRYLALGRRLFGLELAELPYPHQAVVMAVLGKALAIELGYLLLGFNQQKIWALLQAATRCLSLAPEAAQEILVRLQPAIIQAAEEVLAEPERWFFAGTVGLELQEAAQPLLYSRLFKS